MNIFLDDIRQAPDNYLRAYTAPSTIECLKYNEVDILSLDHDLGDTYGCGTGYDVVCWIENEVATNKDYIPPKKIVVHSANPVGRSKMEAGIKKIYELFGGNQK